jgi:hypothetical protein
MFGFFKQLTASFACSRAGSAFDRAISHSPFNFSASFDAIFVFSSSSLAIFYSTSAAALSLPTLSIKTLVSACFLETSTILILSSSYKPLTLDSVSARIFNPY